MKSRFVNQCEKPYGVGMNDGKFTIQAAVLWGAIRLAEQKQILANVYCVKCGGSVQIVNFTGAVEDNGDVILRGSAVCGHKVARVLDTSENRAANN